MKGNEVYFCLTATESEHSWLHYELDWFCTEHGLDLKYYRKLKDGHVPMYREIKVTGPIYKLKEWAKENKLTPVANPHKV